MAVTELHGRPVICSPLELNRFDAPPGQSCGEYMAPFFAAGGAGYLVDNATSACVFCAYKVGDQFYQALGFQFENRWRDLGIFAAFIGSNLVLLFLGVSTYLPTYLSITPSAPSILGLLLMAYIVVTIPQL
jgi:ABC-type multidrug transport system permease subunit